MPVRPLIRRYGHHVTVGELVATDYLEATCPGCHAVTRTAPWQLHLRYPPETKLMLLEGRMRCPRCGRAGPQPWTIWRASPPLQVVPESPLQEARRKRLEEERRHEIEDDSGD